MPYKNRRNRNSERIVPGNPEDYIAIIQRGDGTCEVVSEGLEHLPGWGPRRGPPTPTYEDADRAGREFGWGEAYPQAHRTTYENRFMHHHERGFGHGQMARAQEGFMDDDYDGWGDGYAGGMQGGRMNYGGGYGDYFGGQYGYDDFGGYGDYAGGHYGYYDNTDGHYGHDAYPGYGFDNYMGGYGYDDYMGGNYGYDNYLGGYDGYNNHYGYGDDGYGYY